MSGGIPYAGAPGEEIDPNSIDVYRGGGVLQAHSKDVKVDPLTGRLRTTHGISVETDPARLSRFGKFRQIKWVPPSLKIIQRGRRLTHFEIVPRYSMSPDEYQHALDQVQFG